MSQENTPNHIAIIMDGNGRWAEKRGFGRIRGHHEGAKRVDEIVTECRDLGVRFLTLYTFSTENWNRPKQEVNLLMRLLYENLKKMDKKLKKNKISLTAQGSLHRLPKYVQKELSRVIEYTRCEDPEMTLCLALSYGGREEIVESARSWAVKIASGDEDISNLTEENFPRYFYQSSIPDPDLLIRTGGESRVSNFLLWQIAYSEILVLPDFWPDFKTENLKEAIGIFEKRERRFGKTSKQTRVDSREHLQ